MRIADPIWWRGLSRLAVLSASREDGRFRLLVAENGSEGVKVLQESEFGERGEMVGEAVRLGLPVVIHLERSFAIAGWVPAEDLGHATSSILGVEIEGGQEFASLAVPAWEDGFHVSLMRGEQLDKALEPFEEISQLIVEAVFSPAVMALLSHSVEGSVRITAKEKTFWAKGGRLADPGTAPEDEIHPDLLARELGVSADGLPLLACAVHAWASGSLLGSSPELRERQRQLTQTEATKRVLYFATGLVALLAVWLLWFRVSVHGHKAELEQAYAESLPMMDASKAKRAEVVSLMELRNQLQDQTLRASKSSWYLDQLGAAAPPALRLSGVVLGPSEEDYKKVGQRSPLDYQLIVSGEAQESRSVAAYSSTLEGMDWVADLQVHQSELDLRTGDYKFVFFLRLKNV